MKTLRLFIFIFFVFASSKGLYGQASFKASPQQGCVPLTVNFTDLSTGAVSWEWDFGNGNKSTLQHPSAIYYASGSFSVSLTIWDASGNKSTITKSNNIRAFKNPIADFSAIPRVVCVGEKVTFSSNSTQGDTTITRYSWDMGDGTLLNQTSPGHAFKAAGTYNISLVVTDGHGCLDKNLKNTYIRVKPAPVASFTSDSTYNCTVPSGVPFTNRSKGGSLTYSWDFGDGKSSTQKDPRHTYSNFGTYSPRLTVTDTNGCTSTYTATNSVYLGPITADFTVSKTNICGSGNVQFNLIGKLVSAAKYEWDFGDGVTVTKAYPDHTYSTPGTYTVKLTAIAVYRKCTTVVEKKELIKVFPKPKGKITVSDSFPCKPPFTVSLTYSDQVPFTSVTWIYISNGKRINAGSGATVNQTVYDYSDRLYKAFVTSKDGCYDSVALNWLVKSDSVIADFSGDTAGCMPILANFIDKSISDYDVNYWEWTFHDGSQGFNKNATYLYTDTGTFRVKLFVRTVHGCEDTVSKLVHVGLKTDPDFHMITDKEICNNSDEVKFVNTTKNPGFSIDSFKWIFDDPENNSTVRKPIIQTSYKSTNVTHRYNRDTGWITPMLIGYHKGCPDTLEKPDSIYIKPPYAKMEFVTNPCNDTILKVYNRSILATRHMWIVDNIYKYFTDSLQLNAMGKYKIVLWVWNDSFGCYDTVMQEYEPAKLNIEVCKPSLSSYCTPSVLTSCLKTDGGGKGSYWTLNGTDTVWNVTKIKYNLDTAGIYKLVYHYALGKNCVKDFTETVQVWNGVLKGSITLPTTCLPATIKLIDSAWAPGKPKHAWRMSNGDVVLAVAQVMDYLLQNSYTDTLEIRLTNNPDVGLCTPYKSFKVPTSGPGVRLSWAWQNTCTSSTFVANADANLNKGAQPFTFSWNMGDGTTYNSQFVSHKFKDTGWFDVSLTVTDAMGCKATDIKRIYVPEFRLDIKITSDTSGSGCPPLYVNFQDISTAGGTAIKSWEWDFGDGSFSTLKNPQHQYLIPGRFTVKLKITDAMGCTRTKIFPDFIVISGPYGKYSFDNNEGCYPLAVQFSDSLSENTFKSEWDFGDGVVGSKRSPRHVYNKPGRFIPAVVLSDSFGCKFALPPVDTIYIYDYPQAVFSFNGICLRDSVKIASNSYTRDEPIVSWRWDIEDNVGIQGQNLNYLFGTRNTMVRHMVTTSKGCSDTLDQPIPLKQPLVSYTSAKDTVCLGSTWSAFGTYRLDTTLQSKFWYLDNVQFDTADNVTYRALKPGQYRFRFKVTDNAGCWDTFSKPHAVSVGDTIIPATVPLLRVSVEDDITHDIKLKRYPTFDFGGYIIYRDLGGSFQPVLFEQNRDDTFHFLNGVDALHQSYCYRVGTKNLCQFTQDVQVLETHCTVEVGGKPSINASLLKWNAYTGWPVQQYEVYREDHTQTDKFDKIGTVDGQTLNYVDTSIICYVNHVYRIKAYEQGGNQEISWSDTCHVKPIYINIVPAPEIRRATVVDDRFVRIEWDELKKNRQPIDFYEIEKKDPVTPYKWINNSSALDTFVLHDHKTMVDDLSYIYQLRAVDVCGDKSDYSNIGKSILLNTDINLQYRPVLEWTTYQHWKEGVKEYVIEKRNGNGNFTEVGRTATGNDTTYIDNLSSLNCIPLFEYRVYAIRNTPQGLPAGVGEIRSYSNVDAPPVVTKVFVPNAFTPDANGLNEVFKPQGIYVASYNMKIYNRWGEKVYEGYTCENAWDGTYNGTLAPHGVYIFLIDAKGSDGKVYRFKGDVTLLR